MNEPIFVEFVNSGSTNGQYNNVSYIINLNKIALIQDTQTGGSIITLDGSNEKIYINMNIWSLKEQIKREVALHYNEAAERAILGR